MYSALSASLKQALMRYDAEVCAAATRSP